MLHQPGVAGLHMFLEGCRQDTSPDDIDAEIVARCLASDLHSTGVFFFLMRFIALASTSILHSDAMRPALSP